MAADYPIARYCCVRQLLNNYFKGNADARRIINPFMEAYHQVIGFHKRIFVFCKYQVLYQSIKFNSNTKSFIK